MLSLDQEPARSAKLTRNRAPDVLFEGRQHLDEQLRVGRFDPNLRDLGAKYADIVFSDEVPRRLSLVAESQLWAPVRHLG